MVIGLPRDERAPAAMHLGGLLARSLGEDVVVCTVVPPPWPPGLGRVDAEYQEFLDQDAAGRPRSRPRTAAGRSARPVRGRQGPVHGGRPAAGRERGTGPGCWLSAPRPRGMLGRVAFGSVAERLLHTSPLPVALAPRGFRARPGSKVTEVTAAYRRHRGRRRAGGRGGRGGGPDRRHAAGRLVRGAPAHPAHRRGGVAGRGLGAAASGAPTSRGPSETVLAEVSRLPHAPAVAPAGDRARHQLGRCAGGHRLGPRQHPGRRVELGRPAGTGVYRVPLVQDRPPLSGPGCGAAPRRHPQPRRPRRNSPAPPRPVVPKTFRSVGA